MPAEPAEKYAITFIDGQNLYYAVKESFGYPYPNYDVLRLSQAVCAAHGWRLKETHFYTGVPDAADDPLWNAFWTAKLAQMGRKGVQKFPGTFVTGTEPSSCRAALRTRFWRARKKGSTCASRWTLSPWRTVENTTWR